jgi:hypothetical protein
MLNTFRITQSRIVVNMVNQHSTLSYKFGWWDYGTVVGRKIIIFLLSISCCEPKAAGGYNPRICSLRRRALSFVESTSSIMVSI